MSKPSPRNRFLQISTQVYTIIMILLSLTIMSLSIWDLFFKFNEDFVRLVNKFDLFIMAIFILDLLVNLKLAKDKKRFIKISIIEMIIIIPFTVYFRVPGLFKKTTGISIPIGEKSSYIENYPRLKGFVNILLSQKFILKSIAFIMTPSVTRAAKFFNLSRNYFNKTKSKKD